MIFAHRLKVVFYIYIPVQGGIGFEHVFETRYQTFKRARNRVARRRQKFAQYHGHELAPAIGQGLEGLAAQIFGNFVVKQVLRLGGFKFLCVGVPLCVLYVL